MSAQLLQDYAASEEFLRASELLESTGSLVGGLWGGSFAFLLGTWATRPVRHDSGAVYLIATSSQEEADEITEELEAFWPGSVRVFPAWESLFLDESKPDPTICRERLSVLDHLTTTERGKTTFVVAPVQALLQPVPSIDRLKHAKRTLRVGDDLSPSDLAKELTTRGYKQKGLVELPGEFSIRGDIFDVFPWVSELPLRVEYFGDTIESIRGFYTSNQRSIDGSTRETFELLLPSIEEVFRDCFRGEETLVLDYLSADDRLFVWEPAALYQRAERVFHNVLGGDRDDTEREGEIFAEFVRRLEGATNASFSVLPPPPQQASSVQLRFGTVEQLRKADISEVFAALQARLQLGFEIVVFCENEGESRRFVELLGDHGLGSERRIVLEVGLLRRGFEISTLQRVVLTSRELFNRHVVRRSRRKKAVSSAKAIQSFLELERGDYVVHLAHGIGRFVGIETFEKEGVEQEFLALEFRGDVRVYVPVSKIDLVQKYVGSGDKVPVLDKVGGSAWAKKKEAVEHALLDLASELLEVQASRKERPGIAHPEDGEWQRAFEASFPFEDTPDQVEVTQALKVDLQKAQPMDRLICGDVGYGKTELAMRAAFKAVDGGRQVAILVPTTLLAEQHYRSFRERMAEFPVTVEVLSRFRTKKQQRQILERAAAGGVDILIGTHRILSNDVALRDLGLLVIDEEQRFGVAHKEKLKRLRRQVDVLTLSATPIPRTLHMALLGIRDISSLTTAPEGRSSIQTELTHFDRKKIREIIVRELNRDGQIFFVHNRVKDIDVVKREIEQIVPEARVVVAHGQMNEHELEEKMVAFMEHEGDILLATTIIESGIDIPTCNTIIINEADRYGLADLHQLRGRVGRYKHQAYCYLLLPEHRHVNEDAKKRMHALVEYSGLGAGFQIAMRDLEIRGAGNILGKEQSGHIATVGYDMYCRLLEKCVHSIRKEEYREPSSVEVDLVLDAYIPDDFLSNEAGKLEVYRRISVAANVEAIADLRTEFADRYGKLPEKLHRLFELQDFRLRCSGHGIEYVGREDASLILRGGESMSDLLQTCPLRVVVLDKKTVAIPLKEPKAGLTADMDDIRLFHALSKWLRTGRFPTPAPGRRRFVDLSSSRGKVSVETRRSS